MASTSMDFDWCIAPVTRQAFFEQSYEKTHLVVRRGQRDYYSALLSIDDIDRAVTTLGLSSPEISVVKAQTTITEADFAYESGFVDSVRVMQLFADGATIILSNLQERLPMLATFCRALEEAFSSRIQTNIYLTPAHSQGFRAHYDNHDVIVQQVSGTKEWRIYDMPVVLPLTSQGFDPHDVPIGELTDSFVLEPGDMAYIPRGLTHDAVATDETSLHITTGLMTRPYADLIAEAVLEAAHSDPLFRHALPPGHARDDFDAAAMQAHFSMLMARLVERTSMEPLLAAARSQFIANRVPRAHGQMAQMAALDQCQSRPEGVQGAGGVALGRGVDDVDAD